MTTYGSISTAMFETPVWARNAHIQTIFPKFVFKAPKVTFQRVRINTPDNDFLDLGILSPRADVEPNQVEHKRIAVLFHGLEGSENSHYIQHLSHHLSEHNITTVVMHFRGCSGEINHTPRAYHSGETGDAKLCFKWVKKRYPGASLFAVGFSLGGNMLLKLLGSELEVGLNAAVSVSAPIDLCASSEAINVGFAKRYQKHLLKSMQRNLLEKMATIDMSSHVNLRPDEVTDLTTFRLFDEHVTSKLHGFKNADDYYARCSALPLLNKIQTPSLIIHAKDDPFMDERVIPEASQLSDSVAYEISEHGGHVGFFGLKRLAPKFWLPERIVRFIQEHS